MTLYQWISQVLGKGTIHGIAFYKLFKRQVIRAEMENSDAVLAHLPKAFDYFFARSSVCKVKSIKNNFNKTLRLLF